MQAVNKADFAGIGIFLLGLCVLQNFVPDLEFDRQQILAGQVWRLWTGHFVHSHITHLALNCVAAVAFYLIFLTRIKRVELLCCGFGFSFLISIILFYLYPNLAWYNGLSGLLHAFVSYIFVCFSYTQSRLYWLGLTAIWSKVFFEMLASQIGYQGELAGMIIITQAHLIGVWVGTLSAFSNLIISNTIRKVRNT